MSVFCSLLKPWKGQNVQNLLKILEYKIGTAAQIGRNSTFDWYTNSIYPVIEAQAKCEAENLSNYV